MVNEVDARLALGQLEEAAVLLSDYATGEQTQGRDNPVIWFRAYVSVLMGRAEDAVSLATLFAPNDFDPGCTLDETELMRLWTRARNGLNDPIAQIFPGLANLNFA